MKKVKNRKIEDIWQPICDVDITKRFPDEWARINGIQLIQYDPKHQMNEYEFAYYLPSFSYIPVKKTEEGLLDFDSIAEKEMRLTYIRRDIFLGADDVERITLNNKYTETQWVRSHMLRI